MMQADAVVMLEAGNMDIPSSWIRPGAAVIRCVPSLETGVVKNYIIYIYVQSISMHFGYRGKYF